ncbi:hypothetical protein FNV43_RR11817 [Rhamnella rubrinervis]|uniref:Uncharacterized protein n=1 Tax=Rhamnella rubrinervis TaxID=2594499 RepID=A0A8K0H6D6_9ROSA|nr:hypothetical protein FNV43_RR11817 [Rhamnella rubrinervis]
MKEMPSCEPTGVRTAILRTERFLEEAMRLPNEESSVGRDFLHSTPSGGGGQLAFRTSWRLFVGIRHSFELVPQFLGDPNDPRLVHHSCLDRRREELERRLPGSRPRSINQREWGLPGCLILRVNAACSTHGNSSGHLPLHLR